MLALTLMCFAFLLVDAAPEFQPVKSSFPLSTLAESEKEVAILQCDTAKIKANLELINSDTKEVVQRVSSDMVQLLKDLFICIDPITIGFCIGYVYPSVLLVLIADIPMSIVQYLQSVVPLLAEVVREIVSCRQ